MRGEEERKVTDLALVGKERTEEDDLDDFAED
jgi:hypothetical protein